MSDLGRGLVVAGTASGVGKTTVALALLAAFHRRGLSVQPFKCGPDFIDGGHHRRASGRASRNLDGWMLSHDSNQAVFIHGSQGADLCVVEGVMGLFDGVDGRSEAGSTAEIAKWLDLPVILVVDASSIARSVGAVVHGFSTFDPALRVAGVIFNRVGGANHYRLLQDAVTSGTRVRPMGYLPRKAGVEIPERYLGLFTANEERIPDSVFALLAELAEQTIDLDGVWESASATIPTSGKVGEGSQRGVRIAVARDKAFSFYYEDNLDTLRNAGAEIVEFSPLKDTALPPHTDGLYFGGGYPELFATELAANQSLICDVRKMADQGLPIYAECGGLMYLGREIVANTGSSIPMAGVLPLTVIMTAKLVDFGYTEVSFTSHCMLGSAGTKARGHSFHYSRLGDVGPMERVYRTKNSMTQREESEGFRLNNVLASYIHLHFLSNPALADAFVRYVEDATALRKSRTAAPGAATSAMGAGNQ